MYCVSWRSACALPAEIRPAVLFSTHWRHCSFFFPSIKLQASDLEEGEKGEFNTVVERVAPAVRARLRFLHPAPPRVSSEHPTALTFSGLPSTPCRGALHSTPGCLDREGTVQFGVDSDVVAALRSAT